MRRSLAWFIGVVLILGCAIPAFAQPVSSFAGDWIYHDGGFCAANTFGQDGSAYSRDGRGTTGTWSVEGGSMVIRWSNGWVNRVLLSRGTLVGSAVAPGGGGSRPITFTRDDGSCGGTPSNGSGGSGGATTGGKTPSYLTGDWIYRDGGFCSADTFNSNGSAYSRDGRGTTGTWSVDGGVMVIRWNNGWTNRLTPSSSPLIGSAIDPGGGSRPIKYTRDDGSCGGTPSSETAGGTGPRGGSRGGGGTLGGICANPRVQQLMDEWLNQAIPPHPEGWNVHYESWGRLVGTTPTNTITVNGKPDTQLSRCEWLWQQGPNLKSANGLGTLPEYVNAHLR